LDSLLKSKSLTPEQETKLLVDRNTDLSNRSVWGISSYVMLWLSVALSVLVQSESMEINLWIYQASFILVLVAFFRLYLVHKARQRASSKFLSSFFLHVGILFSGGVWGIIVAQCLIIEQLAGFQSVLIGATAGVMVGGSVTLAPSRSLWCVLLFCAMMPIVYVVNAIQMVDALSINLLFAVCFFICWSVSSQLYKSYHELALSRLEIEHKARGLASMVNQDGLTGIYNRRYFDLQFDRELKRASRGSYELSLLLIDLDHFKKVNDNFGHTVGDDVLRVVSRHLVQVFNRDIDIVARYGGEEFVVLLPYTDKKYAFTLAESLRKRIAKQRFKGLEDDLNITVSIGYFTTNPTSSSTAKAIIDKADEALYLAKHGGRNQIVTL